MGVRTASKEKAMDFTGISNKSILGRLLRLPLRLIPRGMRMPILQGPLRGKWWIVGSGNHGYWLGSYEIIKRDLFVRTVTPGSVFFDLGGNVGYYALLASVLTGPEGRVFTIEPLPRNLRYLREHLRLNRIRNVTVLEAAVSDQSGTAWFEETDSTSRGHIDSRGTIAVRTVALDDLVDSGELPPPGFLKIDIEGAEWNALRGARRMLESARPVIFLSTHSTALHAQCCDWLRGLEYEVRPIDGKPLDRSRDILATPAAR
jgi:FkbM family methyltransferase